ncbi:2-hydroxyacid dehydrogenase [Chryseobacterium caseinilyticum]|uniref:D-glycerate dehydrogenase n=1 Tax=Chryseobacterium caseinilyticum TaxID=2771428 RepID=A0ABR8Z9U7_9FLAO|nr:D-glycerate dehydrogenase [Chryseobacterium caseinilyticum]MBD8082027.1 D-glycerate dehydrogenase [Chryseobacterium caseinilyticum]
MRVFVNKRIPEIGLKIMKDNGLDVFIPENDNLSDEQWLKYCQDSDLILNVGFHKFDRDFFEQCPNLKAIALLSVGFDHVDIKEANSRNIPIGNTPDVLSVATADTAFLLMQSVARRSSFYFERVKNGEWGDFDPLFALGQELTGKTLGVFGLGRIGFEMAKKAKYAFDMNIIYHNRNHNEEAEKELDAKYVSFDELVAQSDVLSIHANFKPEQSELFNAEVLKKMKPNAIFINTARGGFQNEHDLYEALINNEIWGAGLDVTNPEPMSKENPLLGLSNVCVLPHIGSATEEARNGMAKMAADNLVAFSKGEKMPNCANEEVYDEI